MAYWLCELSHTSARIIVSMKLTKYSHACFVIEKAGSSIVVDPGVWSQDLIIPEDVVAVVVTHEHADHCDTKLLSDIVASNPDVVIYAHTDVIANLPGFPTQAVSSGETIHVGDFALEFVGGEHAVIHKSMPTIANLGVIIDELVYHPGDSFTPPGKAVPIVAVPASAPWMKLAETMDFISELKPTRAFPTHDAILSETGQNLVDNMLGVVAEKAGTSYERIAAGTSIDL